MLIKLNFKCHPLSEHGNPVSMLALSGIISPFQMFSVVVLKISICFLCTSSIKMK